MHRESLRSWWGPCPVVVGETRRWIIGPVILHLARGETEWQAQWETGEDPMSTELELGSVVDAAALGASEGDVERFASGVEGVGLALRPALADRPVVTRPEQPFHVLPRQEVVVYVSTPLWAQLVVAGETTVVREFPLVRPSDTWFGPSTIEGELCYASRTSCRMDRDAVPIRPHRAVTALHIQNRDDSPLRIERLAVPVPSLNLYATPDGQLLTESVLLIREPADPGLAKAEIRADLPATAEQLAKRRKESDEGGLMRAFAGLL